MSELDADLNLHGFFGVNVPFYLQSGGAGVPPDSGCAEVSMGQFNHLYKVPQPGKRDVVW